MTEFDDMEYLSLGKRVRLHRLMYEHGPGKGKLLILPIDQGLEHGPVDFFPNPPSSDPNYQFQLAMKGGYSGIALHIGLAEKYAYKFAGKVPLILKLNGKTRIPPNDYALSPLTATVEDAVRIGADAVGYTLYVGSPNQHTDIMQFMEIRAECDRYAMPLIMWSYPRGKHIEEKGGRNSLYAVDYAARVANELGADIVKLNTPDANPQRDSNQPPPYNALELSYGERIRKVIDSAGRTKVLFSGGSKVSDEDLLERARVCMEQGAAGLIFGRNLWQRSMDDALKMTDRLKKLMLSL